MPPRPITVELFPHDPRWAGLAQEAGTTLTSVLGATLLTVHHIGSTAIQGISAKPILDLIPVVTSLSDLDAHRREVESLGYEWWGELGLPGRRYCTKSDPASGRRLVQLHCFAVGSAEIERHLAFRDYLRERPEIAHAYDQEKRRCQRLHPDNSHVYNDCKDAWIKRIEAEGMNRKKLK